MPATQTLLPTRFVDAPRQLVPWVQSPHGPFYFARCDAGDTTWSSALHLREDFKVIRFALDHTEAKKPTLNIDVKFPQSGLLASGAKRYIWFSRYNASLNAVEPLFFGRLIGLPTNLLGPIVTLMYVADPEDYLAQQQAIAETKKKRPNYDPIFLDDAHRDNPDSILEGYSEVWHIDRVANAAPNKVKTSDILIGEDGTVVFEQEEIIYSSVTMETQSAPLIAVRVTGKVGWQQQATGVVDIDPPSFTSYSGDGIFQDWPKPTASLGAGWSVESSSILDSNQIGNATTATYTWQFQNNEKQHNNGDVMSVNVTSTIPQVAGLEYPIKVQTQDGLLDPFNLDSNGDEDPINRGEKIDGEYAICGLWKLPTTLVLRYDADRTRTETVQLTMFCDLQEVTTITDVPTNIELIDLNGTNLDQPLASGVGSPFLDFLDYESVRGASVELGQVIYVPVSVSPLITVANYQICVQAGTAGSSEPAFSTTLGHLTTDSGVVWAALGAQIPQDYPPWPLNSAIPVGEVIRPQPPKIVSSWDALVLPGSLAGVGVDVGRVILATNGTYQMCTLSGDTGVPEPAFSSVYGNVVTSGSSQWTCIGTEIADNTSYYVRLSGGSGITGTLEPNWGSAPDIGDNLTDGGVTWKNLGKAANYIGTPIGDVSRRSYFPSDRGLWSLEYLMCVARAHILFRSRALSASWKFHPDRFNELSCRKNALGKDPRFAGGSAIGKIVNYSMEGDGSTGLVIAELKIGSAIGKGVSVEEDSGEGDYADSDLFEDGVQEMVGAVFALSSSDIGYTPPIDAPADDGLVFPLSKADVVIHEEVHGSLPDQEAALLIAFKAQAADQAKQDAQTDTGSTPKDGYAITQSQKVEQEQVAKVTVSDNLKNNPIWYDLQLKPVAGQSFSTLYEVDTTVLTVPRMYNTEAV